MRVDLLDVSDGGLWDEVVHVRGETHGDGGPETGRD